MDLTDLHTFLLAARKGSFSAAAHELSVPTSTVSRRVTRLEDALGVTLVHRTARAITLTRAGEHLRQRCEPAIREMEDAERSLAELDAEPAGVLRLTAPPDLGSTVWITELFVAFHRRWPQVRLEIDLTERVVDLIAEGVDVALRPRAPGSTGSVEGLVGRTLSTVRSGLYAAPGYLAARGTPGAPDDLEDHRWVAHRGWKQRGVVLTRDVDGERRPIAPQPTVLTNHLGQVLAFVLAEAGVGALPQVTAQRHVESGGLERVLPAWSIVAGQLTLLWPARRYPSPRVRAFIDFATAHFAASPEPDLRALQAPGG